MIGGVAPWFPAVAATLTAGALIGGAIIAVGKLGPERGKITIEAAQGAVIVQSGVIDTLQEENNRLKDRMRSLELEVQHRVGQLQEERDRLAAKVAALESENRRKEKRIIALEGEVEHLKNGDTH